MTLTFLVQNLDLIRVSQISKNGKKRMKTVINGHRIDGEKS